MATAKIAPAQPAHGNRVTTRDVAAAAGVAQGSVSVVLNGARGPHVADATRQRILEVAAELGYRRNAGAAAMRRGRLGNVALVMSTRQYRSYLPTELLNGLHDALLAEQTALSIIRLPDERLSDPAWVPHILREATADGLIVDYTHDMPPAFQEMLARHSVPAVWINALREGDCVRPDDEQLARLAVERLLALGHRDIAYVDYRGLAFPDAAHYSAFHRLEAYRAAMAAAGLRPVVLTGEAGGGQPRRHIRQLLSGAERPTAVVAYGQEDALLTLVEAELLGMQVPEDLSVVTFGSSTPVLLDREMSCVELPLYSMGTTAATLLLNRISGQSGPAPSPTVLLPGTFQAGATSGPPSTAVPRKKPGVADRK